LRTDSGKKPKRGDASQGNKEKNNRAKIGGGQKEETANNLAIRGVANIFLQGGYEIIPEKGPPRRDRDEDWKCEKQKNLNAIT